MAFSDKKGITVASGFKLQAGALLDAREVVDTIKDRDELVTINAACAGLKVFVTATKTLYVYDGTAWVELSKGAAYVHPTTAGNKHIPAGGKAGQILRWSADGTAQWGDDTDTTYEKATTTADGLLSKEDKVKLNGIAAGAEVNVQADWNETDESSDAFIKNKPATMKANGGNADTVNGLTVETAVPKGAVFTDTTYGIATAETAGLVKSGGDVTVQADGTLKVNEGAAKTTIENVTGLQDALDKKVETSLVGAKNGVAQLDATGKVPAAQLPSYVDDVVDCYVSAGKFYQEEEHTTEIAGETGKIYVDLKTLKTYRWSGTAAVEISASLALGETESTAYRGDRGKIAYDHSQAAHAPANAERNIVVGVKKNGVAVEVAEDRTVDITVPTKVSELANDSKFITAAANVASATKLETARNFSIKGGVTAAAVAFDGTDAVELNVTNVSASVLSIPKGDTLVLDGNF